MKNIAKRAVAAVSAAVTAAGASAFNVCAEMTPNPVISRNVPAYSGTGMASQANDEHYFSFWNGTTPDYIAYDLSEVPDDSKKQVIAVWYNPSSFDSLGSFASRNMEPSDYTVEVNKAAGGTYPTEGWEVVEVVEGNRLSSRQHLLSMEGYNWIRLNIAKADDAEGKQASINFDVHNVSDGVYDSWLFLGDSITACGMNNCYGTGFATYVNQIDDRFFPIQENGGIGGIRSIDGRENIDRWLSTSPARFVSIAYGTNDCWGNPDATEEYRENTKYMIDAVLDAGKIPVLPKIPYSTNKDVGDNVPLYNAVIDELYEEYGDALIHGPQFDKLLAEEPDYLSGDGVHPSDAGYDFMRKTWAETMYETVYKGELPEAAPKLIYGDVNGDGIIDPRDASIIQVEYARVVTGSPYSFTEAQQKAADVNKDGKIDPVDASLILEYYTMKMMGSEQPLSESLLLKNPTSVLNAPYAKNAANGFTEEAIENSKIKPKFSLKAERDPENELYIDVTISITGADRNWSTTGFVLDYDPRLYPYRSGPKPKITWGDTVSYLSRNITDDEELHKIALYTIGQHDEGREGVFATLKFIIPTEDPNEKPDYSDFQFAINYNGGELFTDMKDSEQARLMQAYLFTKGLAKTSIPALAGGSTDAGDVIYGDANCDGEVTIADATAILQHIGNPDEYGLKGAGLANADCFDPGSGVTGMDALAVQKFDAKVIKSLPEFSEE